MADKRFDGLYVTSTDDGICFLPDDWNKGEEIWLPKSKVDWDRPLCELEYGDPIELCIPQWLIDENELE